MRLDGKVAVVTAASKGLGKGIAKRFAQEGAKLVIASRSEEAIQAAAEEIRSLTGTDVTALTVDVSKLEDIQKLIETVQTVHGTVDILVNNAGGPPAGTFLDFDDEAWQKAFDLNLMSVVRVTRGLLPLMMKKQAGRIINITSSGVKQPVPNLILSNSIRAAVNGLTKTLSQELAPYGILVNNLAPGRIDTDRVRELDRITADKAGITMEQAKENWTKQIPAGRYGTVEEFANAALFLASDESSYITGQIYVVDGGMVKGY
ncbi:SDR family oxidoreductase [Effusibacillus lacus]|uniref:3-oxoacyl-ACP reductase n=1 Tax=Effusibacillus lacus TaxID=1348429 RepID=A0A292YES1_9BACL|nr:SDR family oxidoreductase [Effusibacillus lacus]TCS76391.1 3-oxoacyl-[acyl-carrier protein] reductase [Effusibacillus lacus]GAX91932.1 3-oxoacyl-ACP reductase [Effusibacillus lacus]